MHRTFPSSTDTSGTGSAAIDRIKGRPKAKNKMMTRSIHAPQKMRRNRPKVKVRATN